VSLLRRAGATFPHVRTSELADQWMSMNIVPRKQLLFTELVKHTI
jgi:hypothetical protein